MVAGVVMLEDRIFELLGEMKSPLEIVRELDMDVREGHRLIAKVIGERDTPNAIRIREGIARQIAPGTGRSPAEPSTETATGDGSRGQQR